MSRCNADFFDIHLNYIYHDTIEMPNIDYDYLTPETSEIVIGETNDIPERCIVVITGDIQYVGIVDAVELKKNQTEVSIKPFITVFDQPVLFDTRWQGSESTTSVEQMLSNVITQYWIASTDTMQNMPQLRIVLDSETKDWDFGIVEDEEDKHFAIVKLYEVLFENALTRYRVAITPIVNFVDMTIELHIGAPQESMVLDADLPGIKIDSFTIDKMVSTINKLEIWNADNYTDKITYYLHTDGTYDTADVNRVFPVNMDIIAVHPESEEQATEDHEPLTFEEAAKIQADDTFGDISWTNYIELEVGNYDSIVGPVDLRVGQVVQIMHNGETYETILTGKKISYATSLIFGTIRVDMTKKRAREASSSSSSVKTVSSNASSSTSQGETSYKKLEDKPKIEGVTLIGNQAMTAFGWKRLTNARIDTLCPDD